MQLRPGATAKPSDRYRYLAAAVDCTANASIPSTKTKRDAFGNKLSALDQGLGGKINTPTLLDIRVEIIRQGSIIDISYSNGCRGTLEFDSEAAHRDEMYFRQSLPQATCPGGLGHANQSSGWIELRGLGSGSVRWGWIQQIGYPSSATATLEPISSVPMAKPQKPISAQESSASESMDAAPETHPIDGHEAIVELRYDRGGRYRGTVRDGKPHGNGVYTLADGYRYDGEFVDGQIQGKGEARFTDGAVYRGTFTKGVQDGPGRITYADGSSYEGSWVMGQIQGEGEIRYTNGAIFVGQVMNGRPHGRGHMKHTDGYEYEGEYNFGIREGHGRETYPDGAVYEGNFVSEQRSGTGTITFRDGSVYEGDWLAGQFNGSGIFRYPNGDVYEGAFYAGLRQGRGVMRYATGGAQEGRWVNDIFQK